MGGCGGWTILRIHLGIDPSSCLHFPHSKPMARSFARLTRYLGSALLLFALITGPIEAQDWRQESEVMVVVEENEALDVFLDSLTAALEENPATRVHRSPQDVSDVTYRELSDRLLDDGLALVSTTHVFIKYQFDLQNAQIVEAIEELHFIYRESTEEEDLSILHVSTDIPVVREVLLDSGVPSEVNMQTVTPFRHFLAFPRVVEKEATTVVQVAGQAIREDHERRRQTLIAYLDGFVKERGFGYKLSTTLEP